MGGGGGSGEGGGGEPDEAGWERDEGDGNGESDEGMAGCAGRVIVVRDRNHRGVGAGGGGSVDERKGDIRGEKRIYREGTKKERMRGKESK